MLPEKERGNDTFPVKQIAAPRVRSLGGIVRVYHKRVELDTRLTFNHCIVLRSFNQGPDDQLVQIRDPKYGNARVRVACLSTPGAQDISFLFRNSKRCRGARKECGAQK